MRWRCSATLPRGDASLPLRQKAGAIAERVFTRNPKHPGAAHYILHAYDHAHARARKALPAARAYAKIAPAASHALHMPAHAFLQLGLLGRSGGDAIRRRGTRRSRGRSAEDCRSRSATFTA